MQLIRTTAILLAFLTTAPMPAGESRTAAEPPNVLFIVCDDLNTHVSTSGYRHIRTPAMDRLAAGGTRFLRTYCQYPVCGPSRSSFLSLSLIHI